MNKVLLTGGTGFLGEEILDSLSSKYKFYSIYRKKPGFFKKNITWIKLDLTKSEDFERVYSELKNEKIDFLIAYVYGLLAERALKKLEK